MTPAVKLVGERGSYCAVCRQPVKLGTRYRTERGRLVAECCWDRDRSPSPPRPREPRPVIAVRDHGLALGLGITTRQASRVLEIAGTPNAACQWLDRLAAVAGRVADHD